MQSRNKDILNGSQPQPMQSAKNTASKEKDVHVASIKIFYGSQTGTAKGFAHALAEEIMTLGLHVETINMKDYDPDDNLAEETTSKNICVFLVSTYTDGQPPESAKWFCKWLEEASNDFRFGKTYLKGMRYAVFGLGNSVYSNHYNTVNVVHHTNPVGTEWRWKMDQPDMILEEAIANHQQMIKQFKGVPGVKADRFEEGLAVKHCALSLVGEPIMYPEINKFLKLLHHRNISSFLVTNAQFPEEIRYLEPVTQLYVSVDASTKESLKKIDRPLFKDFWQRFLDSLTALAEKRQRTVYRLTLVKAWNVDELKAYADLVTVGKPDFIEVKGVTYCGESSASNLTMANVPWHEEVVHFVQELANLIPDYEIACEHEHSNCMLIAHKKFKIDGEWWTWIDYKRFQKLIQAYEASSGVQTFTSLDYMAKTPEWALFGSRERGFDPLDTRFLRKNKTKDISGC
ncbi:hypothetical protein GDO86_003844 [Hymenochirus boettgeri]|uniref:Flavodoxin-like domain-containing protein n=1 Tax=Hymenochirus boettgeri TaxID=247094 RepID=A0A8T2K3C1_9PIPI|nr:hypothetical protein GDO86_003844 [Hymenochirus boettgeri]